MSIFYVYALTYEDGTPFYIGKGKGNRVHQHAKRAKSGNAERNPIKHEIILSLLAKIGTVPFKIIAENLEEKEAFALEKIMIREIGREPSGTLVNLTDGGEGAVNLNPEVYAKMVEAQIAASNTIEERMAKSIRAKALHANPEFKAKHAAAIRAAHTNPDLKARRSASLRAANGSPEAKAEISIRSVAMHAAPGFKEKHSAATSLACSTPEAKSATSARMIAMHANPEFKDRHRKSVSLGRAKKATA